MEGLRIKNWEKFQHYKERKPPWIKLYRELLDDVDWHELPGEAAKGLIMLWLIASEDNGYLPDSKTLSFRLRVSENRVNALLSDCSKWFEGSDSAVLADCKQVAMPDLRDREETDQEKEAEGEKNFHPPTQTEVCAFMQSRKIPDAERQAELFIAHHANRKWRLGGGKGPVMVSWRKAVVTWQANIPKFSGGENGARPTSGTGAGGKLERFEQAAKNVTGRGSQLAEALRSNAVHAGKSGTGTVELGGNHPVLQQLPSETAKPVGVTPRVRVVPGSH